ERNLAMRDVDEAMGDRPKGRFDLRKHDLRSTPSAISSHSSGPSQTAARSSTSPADPSSRGRSASKAVEQTTRAASPPRKTKRIAGGLSASENRGPKGSKTSSRGRRGASQGSARR